MTIRQLNVTYLPDEDRVMLRVTTRQQEEYRLWLTRAVTGTLLQQFRQAAVQALAQQPAVLDAPNVADLKQRAIEQAVQFTAFEPAPRLPLGAEPVLVKSAAIRPGASPPVVEMQLPAGKQLTITLDEEVMGKLRMLLQHMNERARWDLRPDAPAGATASPAAPAAPGDDAPPASPKVLH